ncbi:MAG TPA: helix-turn-helix transcriptional regulator [Candidatus Onthocola stercoravium]|nr:helix-turn-helix transcriptional regulator [Candidatus Onthocola stercoravium]
MNINISRIKEIREDRDLYQSDIAKVLNITQSQYSLYENGIRLIPMDKLAMLAKYYNTSVDYLIGLTDERKPYPKSIIK